MRLAFAPFALIAALLLLSPAVTARSKPVAAATTPAPPKLIVAIAVDQFGADLYAQYRSRYTAGLARLSEGAVFASAFQSHAATETCPGHSTLLTGVHPSRTGIISNNWYDPASSRPDKRIYCAEDEHNPASTSRDPVVSAVHLRVPTLGEYLKASNSASRNVAVSAKDRAVMMMGGHTIDAGYWWKGAGFTTFAGKALAPAALAENATVTALLKRGAPPLAAPSWCAPRDRAIELGKFAIGTGRFKLDPAKPEQFRVSPRMDAATGELALRLVDDLALGKGTAPDLLSISFSATDYIGHAVGNEGMEMCIQMAELDRTIGKLMAALDARHIDYAVVLTADHGGLDTPERLDQQALPRAMRADKALTPGDLGKALAARTGINIAGPLVYGDGPFGDLYLSHALTPDQATTATAALLDLLRHHPQVATAFSKAELAATPLPAGSPQDWTLKQRARASFDGERSGDVVMLLDRAVVPIVEPTPGYTATHGSAWDYDRRVPLLFWRKGLNGFEQPAPVETVDIAPTLASWLKLKVPEGSFDGRCLDLDGGAGNSCRVLE